MTSKKKPKVVKADVKADLKSVPQDQQLPLIFSGPDSDALWRAIDKATTVEDCRWAVYELACSMQAWEQRSAHLFTKKRSST